MSWSASGIFTSYLQNVMANAIAVDLDTDATFNATLYNDSGTPSKTDTLAHNTYNGAGGAWVSGNAITDTGSSAPAGWPTVGRPLANKTLSSETTNPIKWDADDTASANSVTTLAATYGTMVNDATVSSYGVCFNYFGGPASVTLGSFTIVWNSSGILAITL